MIELRNRMVLDLAGDYGQKVQAWAKEHDRFASSARYSLGVADRAWQAFGAKVDSYGNNFWARAAGAGGLALAVRQTATYEESITRIGINANASAERMEALNKQLFAVAERPDVNMKVNDLAAGVAAIVEKTGDLEFASKNMLNLARFSQATGESAEDVGELVGNIRTFGVDSPDAILKVVDAWTEMGKQSGLSLKNMVKNGQPVLAMYQQLGRTGPQALKEVGAIMSMTTKQLGSPRRAMSDVMELLEYFNSKSSRPLMVSLGITDIAGKMQISLDDAMKRIVKYTNGNQAMLQTLFGQTAPQVFGPMLSQFQSGKPMDAMQKYMDVQAGGTQVIQDSARAAQDAAESFNKLYDSWQQFEDSNLAKDIKSVGAELNSINPDTLQKVFKGLEYGAGGLLALYGGRKIFGAGKDIWNTGKWILNLGKKGGGGLGDLAGAAGMAGATPVYVVNMPGSGFGGGMPGAGGAAGNVLKPGLLRSMKALAKTPVGEIGEMGAGAIAGSAGMLLAAGGVGYGVGTLASNYLLTDEGPLGSSFGAKVDDVIGSSLAHFMSLFSDDAANAIKHHDAEQQAQKAKDSNIHLKLSFDSQGNPVLKNVKSSGQKLNFDFDYAGRGGYLGAMP